MLASCSDFPSMISRSITFPLDFFSIVLFFGSFLYIADSNPESEQIQFLDTDCSRNGLFQLLQVCFSSLLYIDKTDHYIMVDPSPLSFESHTMTRPCAIRQPRLTRTFE